jgi:predicted alpha-1,2-mannosidase
MIGPIRFFVGGLFLALLNGSAGAQPDNAALQPSPLRHVNPFIGTLNMGNTYPGAQAPFGMVVLSPNTVFESHLALDSYDSRPGYSYAHDRISGFALTRYSGIGCHAMQDLPLTFTTQPLGGSPAADKHRYSGLFRKENERASPGYYEVYFHEDSLRVEATAVARSGLFRLAHDSKRPLHLILNPNGAANGVTDSRLWFDPVSRVLSGWARSGGFCERNPELWPYTVYFALRLPVVPEAFGSWEGDLPLEGIQETKGRQAAMWLRFSPALQDLTVAVAISYVSEANALENLQQEIPADGFDALRAQTHRQWADALSKVQVDDPNEAGKTAFYTALYHNMLQPSVFQDVNGQYIGFDDTIHLAPEGRDVYANFSLWDTYRTTVQLQAILFPERVSDMVQSLLLFSHQSHGGLPVWTLNNTDNGVMNGYSAFPFIANAYAFGARDFDLKGIVEQMKLAAEEEIPIKDGRGWEELALYQKYGYLPADSVARYCVSKAIEYSVADYALAQLCRAAGDEAGYERYYARSKNVFHNLNPETGYFQPRNTDGSWHEPFEPQSTFGFNEGNAAQYSFSVPQHIETYIERSGGLAAVERRLDAFFSKILTTGWHIRAPHYWLGNEPCFGVNYLYNRLGKPEKNQAIIAEILRHFGTGPDGLAGNDDAGAMSALYVFKALGMYPYVPGEAVLELSRPLFGRVVVEAGHGTRLVIQNKVLDAAQPLHQLRVDDQEMVGWRLDYGGLLGKEVMVRME